MSRASKGRDEKASSTAGTTPWSLRCHRSRRSDARLDRLCEQQVHGNGGPDRSLERRLELCVLRDEDRLVDERERTYVVAHLPRHVDEVERRTCRRGAQRVGLRRVDLRKQVVRQGERD